MLHEASVLSSHLQAYRGAVEAYTPQAAAFIDAARDFLASSGEGRDGNIAVHDMACELVTHICV